MTYNSANHPYHVLASNLQKASTRLFGSRHKNVDSPYMVTAEMRQNLFDNISELSNSNRVTAWPLLRSLCCDAFYDYGDGSTSMSIDALSDEHFLQADTKVRALLLEEKNKQRPYAALGEKRGRFDELIGR